MLSDFTVFIIDPDESIGDALTTLLETYNIQVRVFSSPDSFFEAWSGERVEKGCLLVEGNLQGMSTASLLRKLRTDGFILPIIVLVDVATSEMRRQAIRHGATDVIEKPLIHSFLVERITQLVPSAADHFMPARSTISLKDGTTIRFRSMQPEDAEIEQEFVRGLSVESKRMRFFSNLRELSPDMLYTFTHPQFPQSFALIATMQDAGREYQVAVARYAPSNTEGVVEFAIVVADDWQGHGIAGYLMRGIITAAAIAGIQRIEGYVLMENHRMLELARNLGFKIATDSTGDPSIARVVRALF